MLLYCIGIILPAPVVTEVNVAIASVHQNCKTGSNTSIVDKGSHITSPEVSTRTEQEQKYEVLEWSQLRKAQRLHVQSISVQTLVQHYKCVFSPLIRIFFPSPLITHHHYELVYSPSLSLSLINTNKIFSFMKGVVRVCILILLPLYIVDLFLRNRATSFHFLQLSFISEYPPLLFATEGIPP